MRSRTHMSALLVAALASTFPYSESSDLMQSRQPSEPPRPRVIGEGKPLSRRQKKRQRIAARNALKEPK